MELHQIRYFLAVARTGNFSRAARECHVSQPSLSQQIQKLEAELGDALFERQPRQPQGSTLTPAGELFLPYARQIAAAVEESHLRVQEARGVVQGQLHLGALPTIAPYLLPSMLPGFSQMYPKVEIIVHEETTPRLIEGITAGTVDLALISLSASINHLAQQPLFEEPFLLVLPRSHPLARKPEISMEELPRERFILMQEGHCLTDQTLDFCHTRVGFTPHVSCRSAQVQTLLALVGAGLGISIVPKMAAHPMPGILYRPITPNPPGRQIGFVWKPNRVQSPAAQAFVRYASEKSR